MSETSEFQRPDRIFVGRDDELGRVASILEEAGGDDPTAVVVVVGEAGIGKTSLVREVVARSEAGGGVLTVWATGDPAESSLDFGLVDQLLRAGNVGAEHRDAMLTVVTGTAADVGARLLMVIDELPAEGRLLVVVDDAQDADLPSMDSLAFVARRLRGDRAALIVATRPEGLRNLPAGLVRLAEDADAVIRLGGLAEPEVGDLLQRVGGAAVSTRAARRIHEHTDGHPLHLRLLLEHVDVEAVGDGAALPVVPSVRSLVVDRTVGASGSARRLLDALAVVGTPSRIGVAVELAEIDDGVAALEELVEMGLADVEATEGAGTAVRIRHQIVRSAVYDDLPVGRRLEMHARAGSILDGDPALRHRVAAATGLDPDLASKLIAAAERDEGRGARHLAAEHLFLAAEVAGKDRYEELVLRGADHLVAVGRPFDARLEEIETFTDSALRSSVLGRARIAVGAFGEAKVLLEDAWAKLDDGEHGPDVAAVIAQYLAVISISSLDPDAVLMWGERIAETGAAALGTTMICHGLALRGDFDEARRRATELVERSESSAHLADARLGRGIVELWSNRLERARRELSSVLGGSMERSLLQSITARSHLADAHLRSGRLVEAADMATEAIALLDDAEAVWLTPLPHSIAAYAHTALGDFDVARHHAGIASAFAQATGEAPATIWAEAAWMRLADADRDPAEVVTVGDRMLAMDLDSVAEGINHWRAAYAEALVGVDRLDDAESVLDGLDAYVERTEDISVATEAARARISLSTARGDMAAALAAAESGLALEENAARPLPRALLELSAGALLRRDGRRTDGAALLQESLRRLRAMRAQPWIERCERELAASGLRPAKRSDSGSAVELTPQERIIARLVAEGRTNRQVAEELFISVKTVEHHLSRIYSKLGVRTRTQMAAALS